MDGVSLELEVDGKSLSNKVATSISLTGTSAESDSTTSLNHGGGPELQSIAANSSESSQAESPNASALKVESADPPDLEFIYEDTDTHANEISELYSYTEQPELQLNANVFKDQLEQYGLPPSWQSLSPAQRKSIVMKLLDELDISSKPMRMRAVRCILYIAQGCWAEISTGAEQRKWTRTNAMLLYEMGVFATFTDLLSNEIESNAAIDVALRKSAGSIADSHDLQMILSVLYTITEVMRFEKSFGKSTKYTAQVEEFCHEIGTPCGDELLVVKLLGMVTNFCSGSASHFPMKKVLLLLWKLILVSLGGTTDLKNLKAEKRAKAGLPPQDEDTLDVTRKMRAVSPPVSASDLLEDLTQKRRPCKRSLIKQKSVEEHESVQMEVDGFNGQQTDIPRGLPWTPKTRQKDIDDFLESARMKFVGCNIQGDCDSLAGLPQSIHEGVRTLKEHVYISLAELQIQTAEAIDRNPLSNSEEEIEINPVELLYQAMLPNLPQHMIALLKILLAAAPTSRAKTDSINLLADVLPEEMPTTVLQSMKLGVDVHRHKEIIVKAASAILLLLLKHFKLNHVYQFEFMSQHLVFANCLPLVLKFLNQNIMVYVGAINRIPAQDFPLCVIGDQVELTSDSLEDGDASACSWRNMFSCINLLRILNKLTKWKHSRIMLLVAFKSAPILKRTLQVRHAMMQLYVLKLLKMQTKYLGRQWKKTNMKTVSAIYSKVRHRLNDDWAFGVDLEARPWDFQVEECALRASVDRFNNRRYTNTLKDLDYEPVDNCLSSVLGIPHDLSENFKNHYDLWLEHEVFNNSIEWERLLTYFV